MVHLAIQPHRGNHQRAFPFTGHLGLTPVTIHGVLRTSLEEDRLPLEASSVIIRVACYEGDISGPGGGAGTVRRIYEVDETLWRAPPSSSYAPLGDFEHAFRLVIPENARHYGAVSTLNFRTWRVWWLVEAVVHHRPTPIFGSSLRKAHPVLLVQHAPPDSRPPPVWRGPNERLLLCKASASAALYGAGDTVAIRVDMRRRTAAPDLEVKRVTVELRRIVSRAGYSPTVYGHDEMPPTPPYDEKAESPVISQTTSLSSSDSYFPVVPANQSRRDETVLLTMTSDDITFASDGRWHDSFTGTLPRNRTSYHYSLGETVDTDGLSIRCLVYVQIFPKDKAHGTLEMTPTEVLILPVSAAEREAAHAELKRIAIVQDAERRLFEPTEDGQCRATQTKRDPKRSSVSSESAASRRRSEAGSEPDVAVRPSRARFSSASDVRSNASRSPSTASSPPLSEVSNTKLRLPSFRPRFLSVDHSASFSRKFSISPVIEDEGTPKLEEETFYVLPYTPPESVDLTPPPTSDLYKRFAGFNFAPISMSDLSPPSSPAPSVSTSPSIVSIRKTTNRSAEFPARSSPLSPETASSRAIPRSLYASAPIDHFGDLPSPTTIVPPLVRMTSSEEATTLAQQRRASLTYPSAGLGRFLRRSK